MSIIDIVPSYWRSCIQALQNIEPASREGRLLTNLRLILSAPPRDESLPADVPREWMSSSRHGAQLMNMFGQTETTGVRDRLSDPGFQFRDQESCPSWSSHCEYTHLSAGRFRRPVPVGVYGDVYIEGAGIGRGYLSQPDLTAERFVPDPFSSTAGARLYRTEIQDVSGWMESSSSAVAPTIRSRSEVSALSPGKLKPPCDNIRRCGKASWLLEPPVLDASADVKGHRPSTSGGQRLVAFVVPRERFHATGSSKVQEEPFRRLEYSMELREFLKWKLPDYMVPSAIVELGTLPLTPNGKVDRKTLSALLVSHEMEVAKQEPATTSRHRTLLPRKRWQQSGKRFSA